MAKTKERTFGQVIRERRRQLDLTQEEVAKRIKTSTPYVGGMKVRAAVVQAAPVAFDRARTMDKLARLTAEAARQGAAIAVFPEAFVDA